MGTTVNCIASNFTKCSGRQESKEYCLKHYQQVRKHGHTVVTRFDRRTAITDELGTRIPLGIGGKSGYALIDKEDVWLDKYNWSLATTGYAQARVNGRQMLMHQLLVESQEGVEIDHININRLDNRKKNLRLVTHGENMYNLPLARNNVSGVRGVEFDKRRKKWRAQIQKDGINRFIGYFRTIEEAKNARDKAEEQLFTYTNGNKIGGWSVK